MLLSGGLKVTRRHSDSTRQDEIVPGALCPHLEHSLTSPDGRVPRYRSSNACVQCCASLTEGRLELSVQRIHDEFRGRFMEFWAMVDTGNPRDCWPWRGPAKRPGSPRMSFSRGRGAPPQMISVGRVACYYSWGDVGSLQIQHTCGNSLCCNPLHMRVRGIAHFHHRQSMRAVRLYPQVEVLNSQIAVFLEALETHRPKRMKRLIDSAPDWLQSGQSPDSET
jgi:hypothetical protein